MRRAKPQELKTAAVPAMTARLSEAELRQWLPVRFDRITDPLATPEPSKGALIQLEAGGYVVVYYGEESHELTLEIPEGTHDSSGLVSAFMREVPLPSSRVLWHRPDIVFAKRPARRVDRLKGTSDREVPKRSARRASLPKTRK